MRSIYRTLTTVFATFLLCATFGGCGSKSEEPSEGQGADEIQELTQSEQEVVERAYAENAAEEITAQNAQAEADALAKEIEGDLAD